jgi:hypothetical protein
MKLTQKIVRELLRQSALVRITDSSQTRAMSEKCQGTDSCAATTSILFDEPVGAGEQSRGNLEPYDLHRLQLIAISIRIG